MAHNIDIKSRKNPVYLYNYKDARPILYRKGVRNHCNCQQCYPCELPATYNVILEYEIGRQEDHHHYHVDEYSIQLCNHCYINHKQTI